MSAKGTYKGVVKRLTADGIIVDVPDAPSGEGESSPCCGCAGASLCGLSKKGGGEIEVKVSDPKAFTPGQEVRVRLSSHTRLLASWYLFALPTAALVFGLWLGGYFRLNEALTAVCGLGACLAVYLVLVLFRRRLRRLPLWKVIV